MKKFIVVAAITGSILGLHYFTYPHLKYHHSFYRMLFYIPLVLGSFWFGLKGAIGVSGAVLTFYIPYMITQWQGFSPEDFDKLLEGALYVSISLVLGILVEKERKKHLALVRIESLAAIGRSLSEVAHDMITPLMAIGGFVNQVSKTMTLTDPSRKKMDIVIKETGRLEALVKGMLEFGKPIQLQTDRYSLNELVLEVLDVGKIMAKKYDVLIKSDLDPKLPTLPMDASRIKQVLLNLMSNAIQASRAGEDVLVKTHHSKDGVLLEVTDHGCGITKENGESVFEPFVSTKQKGSGLGLAITKKIVEAHGGEIFFRSNPEKGLTFAVRIPFLK